LPNARRINSIHSDSFLISVGKVPSRAFFYDKKNENVAPHLCFSHCEVSRNQLLLQVYVLVWGENELEEPLGFRRFRLSLLLGILLSLPALGASELSEDCSERLLDLVHQTIDTVAESRPESTDHSRKVLAQHHSEIENRVKKACPDYETCSTEELSEAVLLATHEVLDEHPQKKSRWKGYTIFGGALGIYTAANVWLTMNTNSMTAASLSAIMTIIGAMALTNSGASFLEFSLAKLRRFQYAADADQIERGPQQKRHSRIYRRTQEAVDSVEEMGRYTDRQTKFQITLAKIALAPHYGEDMPRFLERATYVMAKVLSDIVTSYPELDFSEPAFSSWSRVLFAKWYLNDDNREDFREHTLHVLQELFDPTAVEGSARMSKYERVLRSWTSALAPITSPQNNHQSQTERP